MPAPDSIRVTDWTQRAMAGRSRTTSPVCSVLVFAVFLLAVLHPRPALSQTSTTFFVVNRSSINIIEIYASPASSENWGRNWLAQNVRQDQ